MKVISRRNKGVRPTKLSPIKKRKERKVKIPLDPRDIKRLLKATKEGRQRRVIIVFLETGMHPSVMANPEEYDMEIVRDRLAWNRPKTGKLCIWDYEYPTVTEGMLFTRLYALEPMVKAFVEKDVGYHRDTYYDDVVKTAKKAKLKHVSPLTLRHTATIELLKRKPPEAVKKIIQCSDESLWNHYAKVRGIDRYEGE